MMIYDQLTYSFDIATYTPNISQNQKHLSTYCQSHDIDIIIVTDQDFYLSEYTAEADNPRYALTGFTGSTGIGLFFSPRMQAAVGLTAPFLLFVDGRYHIQAEQEVSASEVCICKLSLNQGAWTELTHQLCQHIKLLNKVVYDAHRLSAKQKMQLKERLGDCLIGLENHEIDTCIQLPGWKIERPIFGLDSSLTGRDPKKTIAACIQQIQSNTQQQHVCLLSCLSDDLSFVLNSRGYHFPQLSSHMGYLFITTEKAFLYLPENCAKCPVNINLDNLEVIRNDLNALKQALASTQVDVISMHNDAVNDWIHSFAQEIWPNAEQQLNCDVIERLRVKKTSAELTQIREAFLKSSKAIAETMRWAKYDCDITVTEHDLSRVICENYASQGAVALSFASIAGAGSNSAIIHYTKASSDTALTTGELILLDSGAYYEAGFATDCTRVVMRQSAKRDATPEPWMKKIYTITLKAAINGLMAEFDATTTGKDIDNLVRQIVREHGYDYNHGTGHGVGIHVHEGGIRAGASASKPLTVDAVLTIEPGIYLESQGGVRIENVTIVAEKNNGKRYFENIVFVGYDWELIDLNLLSDAEKAYLRDYEQTCQEMGTELTPCPLI